MVSLIYSNRLNNLMAPSSLDFKGKRLVNMTFASQDLSGVDFSYADIRGVNFSNANLRHADFSHAISGISPYHRYLLLIAALLIAFLAGGIIGFSSIFWGHVFSRVLLPAKEAIFIVYLAVLSTVLYTLTKYGLGSRLGITSATIVLLSASFVIIFFNHTDNTIYKNLLAIVLTQPLLIAFIIFSMLATSIAYATIRSQGEKPLVQTAYCTSLIGAVLGAILGGKDIYVSDYTLSTIVAAIQILCALSCSWYIAIRSLNTDSRFNIIYWLTILICSWNGTNFSDADLTEASFTEANLPYTNLRDAQLKRACWYKTKNLHLARLENTYLERTAIRRLVVTKQGLRQAFDREDLRYLELSYADLSNCSFVGADFSESTLNHANLSGARLAQAKLYGCDISHAILTGSYIQDWAISTDTRIEGVECDYIYMRLPTDDNPDPWRKPDNRNENFYSGDFCDFIAPILKTMRMFSRQSIGTQKPEDEVKSIDFYHYGGIDPRSAALALRQLAEENPDAGLKVVALEGRGNEKIRLQAIVSSSEDASKLNEKYFINYDRISALPFTDIQALLAGLTEKDARIKSLEELLENALKQPKFYVETYQNKGEFIMSQSKGNVSINNVQGNVSGIAAAGEQQDITGSALGDISGSVSNSITQLPDSNSLDTPSIKELLKQLQASIEAEEKLSNNDKVEALEQVKTLAEAGIDPENSSLKRSAKTAMKILRGTVASLPEASKLADACVKLIPAITTILALI